MWQNKKEPLLEGRNCIGNAQMGTRPVVVTVQRIQQEPNNSGPSCNQSSNAGTQAQNKLAARILYVKRRGFFLCLNHYHLLALFIATASVVQLVAISDHSWVLETGEKEQTNTNQRMKERGQRCTGEKKHKPYTMLLLTWQITTWTSKNAWWLKHRSINSTLLLSYQFRCFPATVSHLSFLTLSFWW